MGQGSALTRRALLGTAATASLLGCSEARPDIPGAFVDADAQRGHLLREARAWPAPARVRRTGVIVTGSGIAGLAAARSLRLSGQDDFAVLEQADTAGGNARGGQLEGLACPLGAHYLPLPGAAASAVLDWLEEIGLRRRVAGRWVVDERHLCHSPQERLFLNGQWQDGLLPLQGVGAATLAQYRRFAALVQQAQTTARWTIPAHVVPATPMQQALAAISFEAYLQQHGLDDAHLRWYLDYCCRDDYGAGIAVVSAWAGLHYFASRHGFHAPGDDAEPTGEREAVLTWSEGNAWLVRRLAEPLGERLVTGRTVLRVANLRHGVEVDVWDHAQGHVERWLAPRAIVALPLHVARRVVESPPEVLRAAAARCRSAAWLVANLHLATPLHDDGRGAAPSWDNVLYGAPGLGYVDAGHQSLQRVPRATVLTYYRALGDDPATRALLLSRAWSDWRDAIVAELSAAHPDLLRRLTRIALFRHGHAMAVPTPGILPSTALQGVSVGRGLLSKTQYWRIGHERLRFAHSDWAGYSVLEEAFCMGHAAA